MCGGTEAFKAVVEHGHSVDGEGEERRLEREREKQREKRTGVVVQPDHEGLGA